METDANSLPPISLEDKRSVALPSWYDRLRGLTPRTRFIPICDTFLSYLRADGVFLPATVPDPPVHGDLEGEGLDWEVSNTHHCAELSMDNSLKFDLTDVQHAIGSALQELSPSGHGVFLKTNWSAPKDASFLIGSLQVQAIADVLAMLKSSTCTALDLDACAACGCSPTLCIRSFVAIPPQNEFRVFFVSTIAVAASQRHVHQFYPHLHRDIAECNQRIHNFCSLLSSKLPLPSCVVDIAFTEQSPKGLVIDIDAYCSDTSTLLFSPHEVISAASAASAAQRLGTPFHFEVRVLQNDTGLQPSSTMYYGVPLDLQNSDLESAMLRFQSESSQS